MWDSFLQGVRSTFTTLPNPFKQFLDLRDEARAAAATRLPAAPAILEDQTLDDHDLQVLLDNELRGRHGTDSVDDTPAENEDDSGDESTETPVLLAMRTEPTNE